ncbi:MAG TPA: extracellular solute-binding protein [Chloroflexota bacterium]|jgi:iron(III) transport system substrate-binding protein|nr:extracellular solute-binding protein [Chloroflexota bacterium]
MSTSPLPALNRRTFIRAIAGSLGVASIMPLIAACGGATPSPGAGSAAPPDSAPAKPADTKAPAQAAAPAPPAAPAMPAEWQQWVEAAKKEGKIVVNTMPGAGNRNAVLEFEKFLPGVSVEQTGLQLSNQFTPRILQEREGGVFTWDVAIIPIASALAVLRPRGVWDPVKPILIHPDVLNDANWTEGLAGGWSDDEKMLTYGFGLNRNRSLWINTEMVKEDEIKTVKDLLDPKWKGKMIFADPRVLGNGFLPVMLMRNVYGDDIIRPLFKDQEPSLSRDPNQIAEFLVRGRYPIGLGPTELVIQEFQEGGLGKSLVGLEIPDLAHTNGNSVFLVNNAPHPNAAKVFINWLLTKDGQTAWTTNTQTNSRRKDVPPGDPETYPIEGRKYIRVDVEETTRKMIEAQEVSKQLID